MKIVVYGPTDPDSFADNVADSLRRMGHRVRVFGPDRRGSHVGKLPRVIGVLSDQSRWIEGVRQGALARRVSELAPDLLLTVDRRLHPSVIAAAKLTGAKVALWFPDATSSMGAHDMFTAGYDRIYLKNPVLAQHLRDVQGLPVAYMPEAANSSWHRCDLPFGTQREVVLAGNIHPTRAILLDRLISDGIPVRIYGSGMPPWIDLPRVRSAHAGEYVSRGRKAEVFRSARAVLNNLHPAEDAGTNCRLFEAAACGAAVVTEDRQGLRELFEPGRETLTFGSYVELLGTLRRLLADPEEGRPIADAAAIRAHREHTYERRLGLILDDLVGAAV